MVPLHPMLAGGPQADLTIDVVWCLHDGAERFRLMTSPVPIDGVGVEDCTRLIQWWPSRAHGLPRAANDTGTSVERFSLCGPGGPAAATECAGATAFDRERCQLRM